MNAVARSWRSTLLFWTVLALALACVEMLVRRRVLSPASYAAPVETLVAFVELFRTGFTRDLLQTTGRTVTGFLLGFPIGICGAFCLHGLGRARTSGEFLLDFVRSIPITALVPLFIAIYGVGEANKIAIGAVSALLVTVITVWVGLRSAEQKTVGIFTLYRPGWRKRYLLVLLPNALPSVAAAMRLAVSSALVLVVVAEMFVGTPDGVGKVISDLQYGDNRPGQYAAILAAGCLGYLLNVAFSGVAAGLLGKWGFGNGD
jgi:NitT/TauT family transport system permease protein